MNLHSTLGNKRPLAYPALCVSAALFTLFAGCKSTAPAVDDSGLTRSIQTQLAGDSTLAGLPIQSAVQNGVVTLNGTVANDAQRTIAARDAAGVAGVREVVNNLSVGTPPPASVSSVAAPLTPLPVPTKNSAAMVAPITPSRGARESRQREPAPVERSQQTARQDSFPPAAPVQKAPPAPAQPAFRNVTIPAGNSIPVRITQTLDSASTQEGQSFSGTVASDILSDGLVAIPAGSNVTGHVDAVQEAAHFKGSSLLTVSLTSISAKGNRLQVNSEPYTVEGKGRGKNTAIKTGGGAAVGAVLGGIFGGGKGAAIGAAAGGGLGAGSNAITRGQQVQIPSESVVRFRLTSPVSLRVRSDGARTDRSVSPDQQNDQPDNSDPTLQRRPNQ